MQRDFYEDLINWKNTKNKKPLMVIGARQVGKTYIINKFCEENYKKVLSIDLVKDANLIDIFSSNRSFDEKCERLSAYLQADLTDKDTILFVDEVQESEDFIVALKYFYESKNNYNIICAGSLLGVKLKRFNKSFPVGKVTLKTMYPLSFKEFLVATNNERYIKIIKDAYDSDTMLEDVLHQTLMRLYNHFVFLGGMPAVVQNYIDNDCDIMNVDREIIDGIVQEYKIDMGKYVKNSNEAIRIERIYDSIPSQLIKENNYNGNVKKFVFSGLDSKDNRKRDYVSALDWLEASNMILKSDVLTTPEYPIKGFANPENFKLYINDCGILSYKVKIEPRDVILDGDYSFKGVIAENFVASELVKMGYELFYWSNPNARSEVDFILQMGTDVIPLEVKAGTSDKAKSLTVFQEKYNPKYCIKVSANNFGFNNNIKTIPLYAVFCLQNNI